MADVLKTVKPAGGGDYTTLSAWEVDADANSTPGFRWTAECHNGGSLGAVRVAGWANPGTRIFAVDGQRHTLIKNFGDVVRIVNANLPLRIQTEDTEVDGILVHNDYAIQATGFGIKTDAAVDGQLYRNLLIIMEGATGGTDAKPMAVRGSTSKAFNNTIYLNVTGAGNGAARGYETISVIAETSHNAIITGTGGDTDHGVFKSFSNIFHNNIVLGALSDYTDNGGSGFSTSSNNLSADTTAPGTSSLISQVIDDIFVGRDTDWNLKSGSPAIDAAVDRFTANSELLVDAIGQDRPLSGLPDMGAVESPAAGNPIRGRWTETGLGTRRPGHLIGRTPG